MSHEREPCFVCEKREREVGQILCRVCIAWAEVAQVKPMVTRCLHCGEPYIGVPTCGGAFEIIDVIEL